MKLLETNMQAILALCKRYHVRTLTAFGSVLTPRFREESDIDFLVEFNKEDVPDYFLNYYEFKEALSALFSRDIDLIESSTIRNKYLRQSINASNLVIYG